MLYAFANSTTASSNGPFLLVGSNIYYIGSFWAFEQPHLYLQVLTQIILGVSESMWYSEACFESIGNC